MTKIKLDFANYVFIVLLLALVYLSLWIVKPFLTAILGSLIIAFIFYPLYRWLYKKTKRNNLSALIVSLVVLLIVIVPIFLVVNSAGKELLDLYSKVNTRLIDEKDLIGASCDNNTTFCNLVHELNSNSKVRFYVSGAVTNLVSAFTTETTSFLFSIPKKIIDVFIIFLLLFFILQNGSKLWYSIKELLPLKLHHKEKFMNKFAKTINGVVYGYIITSLIEGFVGWLAFMIVGSKVALLLGIIVLITALLPLIGASVVCVPGAIVYLFSGHPVKAAIIIIAWIIIAWIDSWVRAKIIGDEIEIHPAVVVLGAFGGLIIMGFVGIIIGPLILSLLITAIEIYKKEKKLFFL